MLDAESIRRDALVESMSDTLDVPESAYEQAAQRYEAVGRWLSAANSSLGAARPVIYPQGSFALGTVTKPLPGRDAEYDIDAVVELDGRVRSWTPADLKRVVGDRLREHDTYARMLGAEGRRCWTLDYAAADDAPGFHMDLLPSVGESGAPVVPRIGTTAIAITNRTPARTYEWRSSDPKGYAAWFEERRRIRVVSAGDIVSERRAHVEAVPKHVARMPLQRVVQILKRHRDMMFRAEKEIAPISVILTTLAAHAYRGESSVGEAFLGIVTRLEEHVERPNGHVRISNPIRPEENFADRWEGDALKERAFERWLVEAKALGKRLDKRHGDQLETELVDVLGESAARDSVRRFEERLDGRESAVLVERHEAASAAQASEPMSQRVSGSHPHQQRVPWPERAKPCRVKVGGSVVGGQGARRGPIESRQTRVLPQAKLCFEVDTDAPGGSQYYWQVVNTGADAALANNLRGDFEPGDRTKSETALYRGMHSIECFVVHGGECVGRSGPFFVRVGS